MSAPIGHTCPLIDDVKSGVDNAIQVLEDIRREVSLPERFTVDEEISGLHDVQHDMEQLRTANAALREYGEAMEEERDRQENRATQSEDDLHELQDRLDELKSEHEEELYQKDLIIERLRARVEELEGADASTLRKLVITK